MDGSSINLSKAFAALIFNNSTSSKTVNLGKLLSDDLSENSKVHSQCEKETIVLACLKKKAVEILQIS